MGVHLLPIAVRAYRTPPVPVSKTFRNTDRLAFAGVDGSRIVESGEIRLFAGPSSTDTPASTSLELIGETRRVPLLAHHRVPVIVDRPS
jgi:hypothetical protein